jgi:glucokinase
VRTLVGDIGGTSTRLAVVALSDGRAHVLEHARFPSREHGSLEEVIQAWPDGRKAEPRAAAFGVAGPVRGGEAQTTNLPWTVTVDRLEELLGVPTALLNDVEAAAWGIPAVDSSRLAVLQEGERDPHGNQVLIAPGTGLGEAGIVCHRGQRYPFASEGGHADLAPGDEVEAGLLAELAGQWGHVSWERVLSGPGLVAIHRHLERRPGADGRLVRQGHDHDQAPRITANARAGSCAVCVASVQRFARLLGAEAANLALKVLASGGVFIGGGIAPDIIDLLRSSPLLEGFLAKGRMRPLLARMPLEVICDEQVVLLGCARCAGQLVGDDA